MSEFDAYRIAARLEEWAAARGLTPPRACYIGGEIRVTAHGGETLYTDEALDWCEDCAQAFLARALPLIVEAQREDHFACPTDCHEADSAVRCHECGATLRCALSKYGAGAELAHFADRPLDGKLDPEEAYAIAQIIRVDPRAVALAREAAAPATEPAKATP